ncbi:AlpA family phage regulatory protein [Citrobacter freundii]|nr:AlpA family phage regulatory protein [Citrobacter freundii]
MSSDKFLRLRQVGRKIVFAESWTDQPIHLHGFPTSIHISSARVAWLENEINTWVPQHVQLSHNG